MAVCGRCWICGTKFSGGGDDEGATVDIHDTEERQHTICTSCVGAIDGTLARGENEPHGDGEPEIDRLGRILGLLAQVVDDRAKRGDA